jgi:hypothetical protein
VDGAIECVGKVEYVEGNWVDYGEFTVFGGDEYKYERSGSGRSANSTAGFLEVVCLGAAERMGRSLLLRWLMI